MLSQPFLTLIELGFKFEGYIRLLLNTSYLTDLYIGFTLKMESVSKNTILGLKMMVKSGLEKIFLKFLHGGDYFPLLHKSPQNHKFSKKMAFLITDSILRVKPMYESVK